MMQNGKNDHEANRSITYGPPELVKCMNTSVESLILTVWILSGSQTFDKACSKVLNIMSCPVIYVAQDWKAAFPV